MSKEKMETLLQLRRLNQLRQTRELTEVEKLEYTALLESMPNN